MTTSTGTIPAGVLAVLALPDPAALAEDPLRGALCVWCAGPLTLATAVNLGELDSPRGRWWPRACPACAGTRAHRALFNHAPECADCQAIPADGQSAPCDTARHPYRLVRQSLR
ncbi:hypothetical protein [Streptomyces tagetis]|uniref:Uncharacterized protein n=1 Tax=Streptomyces tagetis TaxID=2820809 RepID=A0A940XC81_9ACTN|nr:hypothetical protein [Streptomyces sp. RG38]MBQ0827643.1 hypothetical protein [Streptomyces sp. RG38]